MRRLLFAAIAILVPLGIFAPVPASAATTPPALYETRTCHGDNGCDLTVPTAGSGLQVAILVSADGLETAPNKITVTYNESTVPAATSISYVNGNSGYSGIFTIGPFSGGTQTFQVRGNTSGFNVWAEALVFSGSSGFAGAASTSTDIANPAINITAGDSNAWDWCVLHDWSQAVTPETGASGFDLYQYWDDPNGDTAAAYDGTGYTSSSTETDSCGAGSSSPSMAGDEDNISGIAVLGS